MAQQMRAIVLKAFGPPSNLALGMVDKPARQTAKEALVKIRACGVNRADTMQRKGKYPPPPGASEILGLEMVGEIEEAAEESPRFKVGQRVMTILTGGGYADYCVVPDDHLIPVPDHLSWEEAACIPEVYLTAFQLLHLVGKMEKGDNVLIHAGASGVGIAATQLAKVGGAGKVITTCSTGKLEAVKENGSDLAIDYSATTGEVWSRQIKDFCGPVNVVLDPVGGAHMMPSVHACAVEARYVVFAGMAGGNCPDFVITPFYIKRLQLLGSTLRARGLKKNENYFFVY